MDLEGTFSHVPVLGQPDHGVLGGGVRGLAEDGELTYPRSDRPRGLALRRLTVTQNWDGLWGWLRDDRHHIYFTSVAVDLSGEEPTVHPPAPITEAVIHPVTVGDAIEFTLGRGAPLFGPRTVVGALAVFVLIFESDSRARQAGEALEKIHEQVTKEDGGFMKRVLEFVTKPGETAADEVLRALASALSPIAAAMKANKDDNVGAVSGIFVADEEWTPDQLVQRWEGNAVELVELGRPSDGDG